VFELWPRLDSSVCYRNEVWNNYVGLCFSQLSPYHPAPTNYRGAISPCKSVTMFGNMTCHCYYIIPFLSIDYGILPKLCHPPFRIRLLDIKPKLTRPRLAITAANVVTDVHPRIIVAVKGNILIPSNRPVVSQYQGARWLSVRCINLH
jgi:hypothetical protein